MIQQTNICAMSTTGIFPVAARYELEGQKIIEVPIGAPNDCAAYRNSPRSLACRGFLYCRTGWNSDTGIAVYKTGLTATADQTRHMRDYAPVMYQILRDLIDAFPWENEDADINGGDVIDHLPIDEIKSLLASIER